MTRAFSKNEQKLPDSSFVISPEKYVPSFSSTQKRS